MISSGEAPLRNPNYHYAFLAASTEATLKALRALVARPTMEPR